MVVGIDVWILGEDEVEREVEGVGCEDVGLGVVFICLVGDFCLGYCFRCMFSWVFKSWWSLLDMVLEKDWV